MQNCKKQISRKDGNTTNMTSHLKQHKKCHAAFADAKANKSQKRPIKINDEATVPSPQLKQTKLSDFKAVEKWPNNHSKSIELDSLMLRFICLSCEPMQLTEKNGFSELFDKACPSYKLKSRQYMTKLLESTFEEKFSILKNSINSAKFVSLTTDLWQNKNKKKGFLSLTCHYIDDLLQRKWKILTVKPMQEAHTAINISNCLSGTLDQFGIEKERIHLVLRVAASSMINAIEDFNLEHFDCFCHKINLALNDGLEHRTKCVAEIKTQVQLCRDLVSFYNRSKNFQNLLARQQELIDAPKNGLIQDVSTRWNSSFFMVDRIIQQQRPLTLAQIDFTGLTLPDFELLKNLSNVLTPFDTFTKQLSDRKETISSVLPTYRCLQAILSDKESDAPIIRSFKKVVLNGLKSRMEKYDYKSYEDRMLNKTKQQSEVELFINPERRFSDSSDSHLENTTSSSDVLSNFLLTSSNPNEMESQSRNNSQCSNIADEIEAFFKASTKDTKCDPIEFWRECTLYQTIKQIVPKFLSPPPSSVESERTFSKLSEIYSAKRSNLSHDHAMQQLFLHFNFDC